jgi:hypothetical protein
VSPYLPGTDPLVAFFTVAVPVFVASGLLLGLVGGAGRKRRRVKR